MSAKVVSAGLTGDQLNAIVKKLGGHDEALEFLRGEFLLSSRNWLEEDGVVYFSVTSEGTTGLAWIKRFEKKGFSVNDDAKSVLCSDRFKPTNGVTTEVAVLRDRLFVDKYDIVWLHACYVKNEANRRSLKRPNAEVACLIREKFSDEEIEVMGLQYILVMHKLINSNGRRFFLEVNSGSGFKLLAEPHDRWHMGFGFAFAVK